MPNWAEGTVGIRGKTAEDVKLFILHFLFDDRDAVIKQSGQDDDYQYFARSFINVYADSQFLDIVKCIEKDDENSYFAMINVSFAWSAHCCIAPVENSYLFDSDGKRDKALLSLDEACKLHHVACEIFTEETGMCFAEHIICDDEGNVVCDDSTSIEFDEDENGDYVIKGGYLNSEGDYDFSI